MVRQVFPAGAIFEAQSSNFIQNPILEVIAASGLGDEILICLLKHHVKVLEVSN